MATSPFQISFLLLPTRFASSLASAIAIVADGPLLLTQVALDGSRFDNPHSVGDSGCRALAKSADRFQLRREFYFSSLFHRLQSVRLRALTMRLALHLPPHSPRIFFVSFQNLLWFWFTYGLTADVCDFNCEFVMICWKSVFYWFSPGRCSSFETSCGFRWCFLVKCAVKNAKEFLIRSGFSLVFFFKV